jgi:TATA-binding protein-associated factor Taf7
MASDCLELVMVVVKYYREEAGEREREEDENEEKHDEEKKEDEEDEKEEAEEEQKDVLLPPPMQNYKTARDKAAENETQIRELRARSGGSCSSPADPAPTLILFPVDLV